MKKLFALFALLGMMYGLVVPAFAEESAAPAAESTTTTVQTSAVATHAAAPTPNKGDTAWMLTATLLVIMMSIPGLALFYGGLVRSKNMLSILMQVFAIFALIIVLWAIYGYSLAFTQGNAFIGGFDRLFLKGIFDPATGSVANAATFSKGVVIPEFAFVAFQATFAAITVALIVGAFAERMKFTAVLLFSALWFTCRLRTWCGSGWGRMPTPLRLRLILQRLPQGGCSRRAHWTLLVAPWCISTRLLRVWLAHLLLESASDMAGNRWHRTTWL